MKIRINNIGTKPLRYIGEEPHEYELDIVHYYPNSYYGKLNDYIANGWEYSHSNTCLTKDTRTIGVSMFDREELCSSIASIDWSPKEECTELTSVGERILGLSEEDRKDFFEVYKIASDKMREKFNEQ